MPAHGCDTVDKYTGAACLKIGGHHGDHGGFDVFGHWHNWM